MKKNIFSAKEHIASFNVYRLECGMRPISKQQLKESLKVIGIPTNDVFVSALRRSDIFTQIGKDTFRFATPKKPIYVKKLDTIYKDYQSKMTTYRENSKKKKQQLETFAA